jgi:hypothetical protein
VEGERTVDPLGADGLLPRTGDVLTEPFCAGAAR